MLSLPAWHGPRRCDQRPAACDEGGGLSFDAEWAGRGAAARAEVWRELATTRRVHAATEIPERSPPTPMRISAMFVSARQTMVALEVHLPRLS